MTVWLPLEGQPLEPPSSPPFLRQPSDAKAHLQKVLRAITKARRIVVVSGAGISTQAGIPDFRSQDGLFQTLKRDNPKELLSSGKDLFDASVFNSEQTMLLFYQMIAQLSSISSSANPTPFHLVLKALDDCGKLLRVYTQNIDSIEHKSGLTFGVPPPPEKRSKSKPKADPSGDLMLSTPSCSRQASPVPETPRCIPLHGTLQKMHCPICLSSFPLDNHIDSLMEGSPPDCPDCTSMEETRQLIGKRARGIGRLRPSVVLYNELHKDAEGVGEAVRRDLVGSSKGKNRSGADLVLVVGTSLRVPGTKRMVREFSKAVRARAATPPTMASGPDDDVPIKSIYLNFDFPAPTREWESVFDTWIQGDVQTFAQLLQEAVDKEVKAKEAANDRRRRREEEAAGQPPGSASTSPSKISPKKRPPPTLDIEHRHLPTTPAKRRKVDTPSTPLKSPLKFYQQPTPLQPDRTGFILRIPPYRPKPNSAYVEMPTLGYSSATSPPLAPPLPFHTCQPPPLSASGSRRYSPRLCDPSAVPPLSA
ncbi:DHS-like NAD/FAD-binding domain-containing protein [Flagelloscypha sp. PMI_526]|nr:DHS-like NAD/FAD-binding domain-containing protein [Flagelloscypha sp. PMI_526]